MTYKDDPRITAYILNELSEEERLKFEEELYNKLIRDIQKTYKKQVTHCF